jgi:hypothetical protein
MSALTFPVSQTTNNSKAQFKAELPALFGAVWEASALSIRMPAVQFNRTSADHEKTGETMSSRWLDRMSIRWDRAMRDT